MPLSSLRFPMRSFSSRRIPQSLSERPYLPAATRPAYSTITLAVLERVLRRITYHSRFSFRAAPIPVTSSSSTKMSLGRRWTVATRAWGLSRSAVEAGSQFPIWNQVPSPITKCTYCISAPIPTLRIPTPTATVSRTGRRSLLGYRHITSTPTETACLTTGSFPMALIRFRQTA